MNDKMIEMIEKAVMLVISRVGDIDTEDGCFADVGTDEAIRLEESIAKLFELDGDDVNESDLPRKNRILSSSRDLTQGVNKQ